MSEDARELIVVEARSWCGTPYHHLGDRKGEGVDCAMLLVRVFCDLGLVEAFDPRPYSPQWHQNRNAEVFLAWLERVAEEVDVPGLGDVGVFRYGRTFSHGAILVEGNARTGSVVHAVRKDGEVKRQSLQEQQLLGRPARWFSIVDRFNKEN